MHQLASMGNPLASGRYGNSFTGFQTLFEWTDILRYSIETPSMVDPHWNILYWRSKWIFHTVYWGVVGCEWGTTSVYFGITYNNNNNNNTIIHFKLQNVSFITSRLPVFVVGFQYQYLFFIFCQKYHLKDTQNLWKIHVGSKLEWGL